VFIDLLYDGLYVAAPITTTTMAAVGDGTDVSSSDSVSVLGRVAVVLGSEENAIRILFSLLLGALSAGYRVVSHPYSCHVCSAENVDKVHR